MNVIAFLDPFIVLFALIALGVLIGFLHILDEKGVSQLSSLVVNVTLPAGIFLATAEDMSPALLASAPIVLVLGVATGALSYVLGRLVARRRAMTESQVGVYAFAAGCTNTGFLGIPLVQAVMGPSALVTAVLYDFTTTINIFTFGVAGLDRSDGGFDVVRLIKNLLNPMFLSLVLGVLWSLTDWSLPHSVRQILDLTGSTTTPLAMICLGQMLYASWGRVRQRDAGTLPLVLIRLILAPAVAYPMVLLTGMPDVTKAVCVLQAGMPSAMLTPMLARQYGSDHQLGLVASLGTTVVSLLTLPLLSLAVMRLFGLS